MDLPTKHNIEALEDRRAYLQAEVARTGGAAGAGSFWKRELKALERIIALSNLVLAMSKEQRAELVG
jgi:hypothetical protein